MTSNSRASMGHRCTWLTTKRSRRTYRRFLAAFAAWPGVAIGYSYKTNPLPGVLQALHGFGAYAEVISHFELWLALQLGVPPERIIFNGPAKTEPSLQLAVERGVGMIHVDGPQELELLARIACERDRRQRVGVRVVTSVGWSAQFGFPIHTGAARQAMQRLAEHQLDVRSLHLHLGTGIKNADVYAQAVREVIELARELRERDGIEIRELDLGGGFGVATVRGYEEADERLHSLGYPARVIDPAAQPPIEAYGERITTLLREFWPSGGPTVFFEPGRAITSSAQHLLLEVLAIKPGVDGARIAILSGGRNVAFPPGVRASPRILREQARRDRCPHLRPVRTPLPPGRRSLAARLSAGARARRCLGADGQRRLLRAQSDELLESARGRRPWSAKARRNSFESASRSIT